MRRHKRRNDSEINLTPLLDVLFSILFIVMMSNAQKEQSMKSDYEQQITDQQEDISKLEEENSVLQEQILDCENQIKSYDIYQSEAVIVTMSNNIKSGKHHLIIKKDTDTEGGNDILLGNDNTENITSRINAVISKFVEDADNQPIYIVFHCDIEKIYTKEYNTINSVLDSLQKKHKEVFYKVEVEEK